MEFDPGYECGICRKSITRDQSRHAVVLYAVNFLDWEKQVQKPRSQQFWAHAECLNDGWHGRMPWEVSVLVGDA